MTDRDKSKVAETPDEDPRVKTESKIQHTDALSLCNRLTSLHNQISGLQHELVLHYCATGVPSYKTKGAINCLEREMERVQDELDVIKAELEELDR